MIQTKRRILKISNQFDLRLAGLTISPTYTQSIVDIYSDGYSMSDFLDFNLFGEKIGFTNKFMVDVPLRKITMRFGMLAERSKSNIKLIDNRTTNIMAVLGFSFDYRPVMGRRNNNPHLKTIFE